jgi:Peptidase A4 family
MIKPKRPRSALRLVPVLAIAAAVLVSATPHASAATGDVQESLSENWSGYTAGSATGSSQFSSVSGSWVEPSTNCTAGGRYSAFWVGLGGAGQDSQALEQIGTSADCAADGASQDYAWYELVPAAQVRLGLAIHAGDHISANVTVSGTDVTVALSDQTSGDSTTKALQMSSPDTSSAEWIAEAPSSCDQSGDCQPLPLADFGTVTFTGASATAAGHTGPISDPAWTPQAVQLSGGADDSGFAQASLSSDQSSDSAQPSSLSSDGSSFSVSAQSGGDQSSGSDGSSAAAPGGYSGGDGSGYDPGGDGTGGYGPGGYDSGGSGAGGYDSGGSGASGYGGSSGWYPGA